jgi:hypothetical protein
MRRTSVRIILFVRRQWAVSDIKHGPTSWKSPRGKRANVCEIRLITNYQDSTALCHLSASLVLIATKHCSAGL